MTMHPPELYSHEMEKAYIASVINANPRFLDMYPVDPSDFHDHRHVKIIEKIIAGHHDIVALSDELPSMFAYIAEISTNTDYNSYNVENYASTIRRYAERRGLVRISSEIANSAYKDDSFSLQQINDRLTKNMRSSNTMHHVSELVPKYREHINERMENPSDVWGIPLGFSDWDKQSKGAQRGEVFIIAGESGVGKTMISVQAMYNMAKAGHAVAIFEMEMKDIKLIHRLVSAITLIPTDIISSGRINENQNNEISNALQLLAALPIFIDDSPSQTPNNIRATLSRLLIDNDIKACLFDYSAYIRAPGEKSYEIVENAVKEIRAIAKQFDVAAIMIHSLVKDGSLRGTAEFKYAIDDGWVMKMPEKSENQLLRYIAPIKQRNTPNNSYASVIRHKNVPVFYEVDKRHVEIQGGDKGDGFDGDNYPYATD